MRAAKRNMLVPILFLFTALKLFFFGRSSAVEAVCPVDAIHLLLAGFTLAAAAMLRVSSPGAKAESQEVRPG
jgi:hypothetical protein